MADNISPEEKLLRLIRNEPKRQLPPEKQSVLQTGRVNPVQEPVSRAKKEKLTANLRKKILSLNPSRIVLICFFISLAYFTGSFVYPVLIPSRIKIPDIQQQNIKQEPVIDQSSIKPLEFYRMGIANQEMFHSQPAQETAASASAVNHDILNDINLIGVIAGDNPQAVIEDKKTGKTFYVSKGQLIGDLQVEDILDGKIILNLKGQKFELYL
ncbi:MAG: hypothetical protein WC695_04850 [Candidatus Omnitrophota bacterium]